MIGNDVIDLAAARKESNWRRSGFLQKIFSDYEKAVITKYPDPEVMVWVLWSMKESAYKIYNRDTGIRAFIPHLLECTIDPKNTLSGSVIIKNQTYFTRTIIENEMIHTVAVKDIKDFSRVSEVDCSDVIKDKSGLPFCNLFQPETPASVSHHGRFRKNIILMMNAS